MNMTDDAAFAAVEVVIWQLVSSGVLPAAPLATELERYAGFSGNSGGPLQVLARVTRAAAYPTLVRARPALPNWDRLSTHHALKGASVSE